MIFLSSSQSILVKGDFVTLISGIRGEVKEREEIMKEETDFFSCPVTFQHLAIDVIRPDTISQEFSEKEREINTIL